MFGVASFRLRVRALFRRSRVEHELHDELQFHLAEAAAANVAAGMSAGEARAAALRKFGSISEFQEAVRDERRIGIADRLMQDIRYGVRVLLKAPLVTAVAVVTLALGIGANTAMFGLLDSVLLRRLSVPRPEQLLRVVRTRPDGISESLPYPLFRILAEETPALGSVAGFAFREVAVADRSRPVIVQLTSAGWFRTLGIGPRTGRVWSEEGSTAERGAIVSARFAAELAPRSGNIIGSTVRLGKNLFVVIGVMPAGFSGVSLEYSTDVWLPIELQPEFDGASSLDDPAQNWVRVIARLSPAYPPARAAAAANLASAREREAGRIAADSTGQLMLIAADRPELRDRAGIARPMILVMVLVGLVLLIASANIANLQLARGATRRRELTIRLATGASRDRLIRQLLTESLLLSLGGGALGVVVAFGMSRALVDFALSHGIAGAGPDGFAGATNLRVLTFATVLSVVTALAFGLVPALRATRIDLATALKLTPASSGTAAKGRHQVLLVMQLAISLTLLIAGGMVMRALVRAQSLDLGFDRHGVVQVSLDWRYIADSSRSRTADRVVLALRAVPGVRAAAVAVPPILGSTHVTISTDAYGTAGDVGNRGQSIEVASVAPEYFPTMQVPLLRGRGFSIADRLGAPSVVMLNRSAAESLFGREDVVGQQFDFTGRGHRVMVIGVVGDTRIHAVLAAPPALVYVPFAQDGGNVEPSARVVEVRIAEGSVGLHQLAAVANSVNADLHAEAHTVDELIGDDLALEQVGAWATGAFGLIGLLLAAIGVYGLHAYVVSRRTAETGIRLALGASSGAVLWLLWRQAMRPVMLGTTIGLVVAVGAMRLLRNGLFGVTDVDPSVAAAATLLLVVIAGMACFVPARRASRLSPTVALRTE